MEPLFPNRLILEERSLHLLKVSSELSSYLHPLTREAVARLLELMNSYYTNLIEGNTTLPLDIERAQRGEYTADPKKRSLQMESSAHIEVQREFEHRVRSKPELELCTEEFLRSLHRAFYERLPEEFRMVKSPEGKMIELEPGELRKDQVIVGRHIPPEASFLPRFLERFHEAYEPNKLGSIEKIFALAASHHRLAWIHPFLDGNGRVVRLYSHLFAIRAGLDSNGLWALSRGLARRRDEYYGALAEADQHRYDDYDGRGNLSLKGLNAFCAHLIEVASDQVEYMSKMLEVETLLNRLRDYARLLAIRGEVGREAEFVLEHVLLHGSIKRSEVSRVTELPERSARRIIEELRKKQLLISEGARQPWRLHIPVEAARYLFPSLFPG